MLTVVCVNTRMFWVFNTASKRDHVYIILFILTTFNDEQHPCKLMRVYEDGTLVNSTDAINLIVDYFSISNETTGCDTSWINGNNERHNRSIYNMVRARFLDSNKH